MNSYYEAGFFFSFVFFSSVPIHGFLEDYVFVIQALFDLYEATLDSSWLEWAVQLQHKQDELFWDPKGFAYFSTEAADPSLLFRMKDGMYSFQKETPVSSGD